MHQLRLLCRPDGDHGLLSPSCDILPYAYKCRPFSSKRGKGRHFSFVRSAVGGEGHRWASAGEGPRSGNFLFGDIRKNRADMLNNAPKKYFTKKEKQNILYKNIDPDIIKTSERVRLGGSGGPGPPGRAQDGRRKGKEESRAGGREDPVQHPERAKTQKRERF